MAPLAHDSVWVASGVILANWEIGQDALEIMSSNTSEKYFPSYLKINGWKIKGQIAINPLAFVMGSCE